MSKFGIKFKIFNYGSNFKIYLVVYYYKLGDWVSLWSNFFMI